VANLHRDLHRAAGGTDADQVAAAGWAGREALYAELDSPYRAWVRTLDRTADRPTLHDPWRALVLRTAWRLADRAIEQAGRPAWIGRTVEHNNGEYHINASIALESFRRQFRDWHTTTTEPSPAITREEPVTNAPIR